jgi:hypothetical protein
VSRERSTSGKRTHAKMVVVVTMTDRPSAIRTGGPGDPSIDIDKTPLDRPLQDDRKTTATYSFIFGSNLTA